jgi:hypothetical protein
MCYSAQRAKQLAVFTLSRKAAAVFTLARKAADSLFAIQFSKSNMKTQRCIA